MTNIIESNLEEKAREIRKSLITALYHADSGHPGSSLSWTDIAASLFFNEINLEKGDRFMLSKGHAVPTLYAILCMKGYADEKRFEKELRKIGSPFQGHPVAGTLPHIYASTGSLGQGLSFALGMAEAKKLSKQNERVYVLLGDGELQEGQNWEAFRYGCNRKMDNLIAIIDKNGYQNDAAVDETMPLGNLERQLESFGWNVIKVDGHNFNELRQAYANAKKILGKPTAIIAETVKGKGVRHIESNRKKHNGAMTGEEYVNAMLDLGVKIKEPPIKFQAKNSINNEPASGIRDAFGEALAEAGKEYGRLVVVDCDLGSATKTLKFKEKFPERFFQVGIAEQHGVSLAAGLAKEGYRPFISSFGAFLTQRAKDQIMNSVAYSNAGVVLVGSHSGLAIGKDGATQMGIDDINAMMAIPNMEIYSPASAVEIKQVVNYLVNGNQFAYLRTSRRPVPNIHDNNYSFNPERVDVIKDCGRENGISIMATGDMVYYALQAAKELEKEIPLDVINFCRLKPIDRESVISYARRRAGIITLEDHSIIGGLGSRVCEIIAEEGLGKRVLRQGLRDCFGESGEPEDLYKKHKLDIEGIKNSMREFYLET